MKRLFILGILTMSLLTGAMLFSTTAIALLGEDGLAIAESSGATQSLRSGTGDTLGLVPVNYEDTVYASLTGYYVGKERIAIDKSYPIFINGGAGLRFLDEEVWLFSADVDLLRTFEGMYLNDGTTYHSDMSQADAEEFILLVLSNGLHMNAQKAVLTNRLGSTVIPANSILYFSEEALHWYHLDNQSLLYGEETALFDATLTIGDHTYDYYDLLKAIGVIQEAIDKIRDNKDPEDEINGIIEILGGEDGGSDNTRRPHSGNAESGDNQQLPADATDAPERFGDSQTTQREDDRELQSASGTGSPEVGKGSDAQGDTQQKEPDGAPDESENGNWNESGETDDGKSESGKGNETGGGSGNSGSTGGSSSSGGSSGSGGSGSSSSSGNSGSSGGSSGSSGSSGGSGSGNTEGENSGDPGQNVPGSGGEQGSGGAVNPDAGTGESGTGAGASGSPAYQDPVVTLTNMDTWSYAFHGKLTIIDPANTMVKGVRIAVYRAVDGRGEATTNEDGYTVYPAENYEGKTALLRKNYVGTQEFAMATLPPDTDIYVQYSYRFNAQEDTGDRDTEGNPIKVGVRKTVTSDIIKLRTPDNTGIAPVAATWEERFAALDKDVQLDALKLRNTTDHNPEAESFDYENFKKDTLSYVNRLEFTLTPVTGGDSVTLSTNSSVLRAAKEEFGATFTSSSGKLKPSTEYTYTVRAVDRYGNAMPLIANDFTVFSGTLYTRKTAPTVKIEEVSNVTDQLTLKVTVSDPSGALLSSEPLRLTVSDSNGVEADLYGSWKNGDKFGDAGGSSHETVLKLTEPAHDRNYTFTLDSLAFAKSYVIRVTGSYDPQPTGVAASRLDVVRDATLGTARSYTASLSSGSIQFSAVTSEISDTYATLGFTMNKNTTLNILPIVDAFQLTIRDPHGNAVLTTVLTLDELDITDYEYNSVTGSVVLQAANAADHTPRIELVGDENQFTGLTLWEALLLRASESPEGSTVYSNPVQIRVSMPEGTLETSTTYQMDMESLVYKSGVEYQVPTSLTTNQFRTKKIQPRLEYEDFFVGGDVAQFIGLRIFDQDETIQQNGLVYVDLYYGETLLSTKEIYAIGNSDGETMDLIFENVISGAEYTIVFRAAAYNDGSGFSANKQLWSFSFLGGSGLSGKLTLERLEYTSTCGTASTLVRFTGEEVGQKIDSGSWECERSGRALTENIPLPEDATFVRIDGLGLNSTAGNNCIYFYNAAGTKIRWSGSTDAYRNTGGGMLTGVPVGAESMRLCLSDPDSAELRGLQVDYYTTAQSDLVKAENTLIPVQPGDLLCFSPMAGSVDLYNEAEKPLGTVWRPLSSVFVVPNQARYISVSSTAYHVYKVASAAADQGYTAEVSVSVEDSEGYLAKLTQTPSTTVSVYKSDNIVAPVYTGEPLLMQHTDLTEQESGAWTASMVQLLESLEPGCSYKMVLTADYRGSTVELDTVTFRTDGVYFTISNQDELQAVNRNPYANYIVVSDFTVTKAIGVSLRGTIDFQGHVITNACMTGSLFDCVYQGAEVRNLVVDYPENAAIEEPLFSENRGLVEDLIVRTNGTHTSCSASALLFETNRGTVRNFVVRLSGDLYLSSTIGGGVGLLTFKNMFGGLIENGYIYGADGAGIVFERGEGGYTGGILLGQTQYGTLRNVFTRMDIWFPTEESGTESYTMGLSISTRGTIENIYHVGDYYLLGSEGQKNLSYRLEKEHFFSEETDRIMQTLWHVSQYNYDDNQANKVSSAAPANLYDAAWQENVLGDGFDVENCVPMGFYPRLALSDCMQKHQEYLPLPALYGDAPKLVGDGMADGFVQGNEVGVILLRFQNERALPIRSISISGLQVNQIRSQGKAEDGLWDVVADVTALEFRSAYEVTSFTYLNGTAIQNMPNAAYTTTEVEFWKEVDSLSDWRDINDRMDWNYRLTADLDFASDTLMPGAIMLNGSKTDMSKTVKFTGKLDGSYYEGGQRKLHTIRNLTLANTLYPYVIYRMDPGSVLSNLVIEGMTLTASARSSSKYAGFVAYADAARIENVHIRNSEFRGVGSMGTLLGENKRVLTLRECSVAETILSDTGTDAALYAGGLVGKPYSADIRACYVRNIEMSIQNSATVSGVGGLIGYNGFNDLHDCYTTGTIRATASQVGGVLGSADSNSQVTTCWSDMDLFVTGDYVGGIGGSFGGNFFDSFLLSVGDISANGDNVGRLFGKSNFATANRSGYAFAQQLVTGLEMEETGDVTGLLTSQQLGRRSTWTDLIRMGSSFEYDSLAGGYFPKVLNDARELVWGQENIPIPGLGSDHYITIQQAVYDETLNKYHIIGQWTHPGYTTEQFAAALEGGVATEALSVTIDGLGLTDEHILNGRASIAVSKAAGEGRSNLSITCSDLIKALDTYVLTVKYDGISIQADIDFGEPLYHEVSDLATWNELMRSGHGSTGENFRIVGLIDFENSDTLYKNLKIGRMEGVQKSTEVPGFCNMTYFGSYTGNPWIESISGSIKSLTFRNITADFSDVIQGAKRAGTGLVLSVTSVEQCAFKDIHIGCNGYSSDYVGFFSTVNGNISDVSMENMSLTVDSAAVSNYGGALAGYSHGGISSLTAENITVSLPKTSYVGGIVGYGARTTSSSIKDVSMSDIFVEGCEMVGGFAGENYQVIRNCELHGFSVKAVIAAGGFASNHRSYVDGLTVENGSVTTTSASGTSSLGYTGGAFGWVQEWYEIKNAVVQDVTVSGNQYSGGLLGKGDCYYAKNIQILGCTITSNGDFTGAGAGGVFGQRTYISSDRASCLFEGITVRDTDIKAVFAAGGVGGKVATAAVNRCYIAEDVTVTATGSSILSSGNRIDGCAGGVFGEVQYPMIQRTACGAKVTGARNVGGLIGELDWGTTKNAEITSSYYVGTVTATQDAAAGVIGYVNGSGVNLTASHVNGVLVAGTITTPGNNASLLTNQKAGLTPDGKIGVWDNTVLNGQAVASITGTSDQTGISKTTLPVSGTRYTAADFKVWKTYEDMGFTAKDVKFSKDDAYMPFVYASGTGTMVLPNTADYDDEAVGILKPLDGGNPDATVVYASGVNTVNIEVSTRATSVTVNDISCTPDKNGVVTLSYDFKTGLTVDGVPYSADDLWRIVMTYGDYWYYIEDGLVYYGKDKQNDSKPKVPDISNAVHLWQGKVLCDDGSVYTLSGGTAAEAIGETVTEISQLETAKPFWSYRINDTIPVEVYHDFTLYADERVDYRMFELNGTLYSVSPYQNMVYDGVMLSLYDDNVNAAKRYYALLGQDGSLVNYLTAWAAQGFRTNNIDHISNNLGCAQQIVLARYKDGSVAGYDYSKGKLLFSTMPTAASFRAYAGTQLRGLFASFFSVGSSVATDDSFLISEALVNETPAVLLAGSAAPGHAVVDGSGQTGDHVGEADDAVSTEPGSDGTDEVSISEADGAGIDTGAEDANPGVDGTADVDGESDADGDAAEDRSDESGAPGGTDDSDGSGASAAAGESDTSSARQTGAAAEGSGSGEENAASGTYYVPGRGVVENGVVTLMDSAISYSPGKGVYAEGVLLYAESLVHNTVEMPEGLKSEQAVELVTPEEHREQVLASLPMAVAYDPVSGAYTVMNGAELLNGAKKTPADSEPYYAEEMAEAISSEHGDSTLEIGLGFGRTLTEGEQSGFMLFAVLSVAAGVILVLIYIRVVRKRR